MWWVEKLSVDGLKSFREQTTVELVPGHNVIVGRNGSGKSNLLYALSCVLNPTTISQKEAPHIIHQKKKSAIVEVLINNETNTLAINQAHVRIRRIISYKCDEFYVDGKKMPMKEVVELLEVGGMSSNNPYNFVRQGTIANLAAASSKSRYEICKKVAGISVYEKNKTSCLLKHEDIRREMEDINVKVSALNEEISELQKQETDLKKFKNLEQNYKEIRYTVLTEEYEKESEKMKEKQKEVDELKEEQRKQIKARHELEMKLNEANKDNEDYKQQELILCKRKDEYQKQVDSFSKDYNTKSLLVGDKISQIKEIEQQIKDDERLKVSEDKDLQPRKKLFENMEKAYQEKHAEISKAKEDLEIQEERLSQIFAKTARKTAFKTPKERKEWFLKELKKTDNNIQMYSKSVERLISNKETLYGEISEAKLQLQADSGTELQKETEKNEILKVIANLEKDRLEQDLEKKAKYQHRMEAQDNLKQANDKLADAENMLRRKSNATMREKIEGAKSIKKVLEHLESNQLEPAVCNGAHGIVADAFICKKSEVYIVVSAISGSRLFNYIVKDKDTANRLLYWKKELNLPGQVDIMPLSLIRPYRNERPIPDKTIRVIDHLQFDQKFNNIISYIFGSYILCKDNTQFRQVMTSQYDGITLDGDMASRKGVLSGGYYGDRADNKFAICLQVKENRNNILKYLRSLKRTESLASDAESKYRKILDNIEEKRKVEQSITKTIETAKMETKAINERIKHKEITLDGINEKISAETTCINRNEQIKRDLIKERDHSDNSSRSQETEKLIETIEELKKDFKTKFEEGKNLQRDRDAEKNRLELAEKTIKDRETILNKCKGELELYKVQVDNLKSEENSLNKALKELRGKIRLNDDEIKKIVSEKQEISKRLSIVLQEKDKMDSEIARIAQIVETIGPMLEKENTDISRILEQRANLLYIPGPKRSKKVPTKQLLKEQKIVKGKLDELSNKINPAAVELLNALQEDRIRFSTRIENAQKDEVAVKALFEELETFREEKVRSTYDQLEKYLGEVFQKLVPGGTCQLYLEKEPMQVSSMEYLGDSTQPEEQVSGMEIKVSFNGKKGFQQISSLSGGQRTIISLSFIYAIQRCFDSPVYIFDEVDAALDANRRKVVADYINTICSVDSIRMNRMSLPQFISTTFRKELLKSGDNFIGVQFENGVSHARKVTQHEAENFIEHTPNLGGSKNGSSTE